MGSCVSGATATNLEPPIDGQCSSNLMLARSEISRLKEIINDMIPRSVLEISEAELATLRLQLQESENERIRCQHDIKILNGHLEILAQTIYVGTRPERRESQSSLSPQTSKNVQADSSIEPGRLLQIPSDSNNRKYVRPPATIVM